MRLNRFYSGQLSWKNYHEKINDFLLPFSGQQNVSLSEEAFAQAVAEWQQQQGFSADGVIGPNTWAKMKTFVVPGYVSPSQLPVPVASTTGTSSIPSLGTLGKLMIDTSVPALSKSYPEYKFTSEDAIWLANKGNNVIATDASPKMIEVARQKALATINSNLVFQQADFSSLKVNYTDKKFLQH